MTKRLFFYVLMCGFTAWQNAWAQSFPFIHYGSGDGLPDMNVFDMLVGKDGNMWLATDKGITSFDGITFRNFKTDFTGRSMGAAIRLCHDPSGKMWIGTHKNGVFTYEKSALSHSGLHFSTGHGILFSENRLFILSMGELTVFDTIDSSVTVFNRKDHWRQACFSSRHGMVIMKDKGLYRLTPGLDTVLLFRPPTGSKLYSCTENSDGDLLIGGSGKIFQWRNGEVVSATDFEGLGSIYNLMEDSRGRLWFSGEHSGLFVWAEGRLLDLENQLGQNVLVSKIIEDGHGNVWIATIGDGMYRFHHTYVQNYTRLSGYEGDIIFRITAGPDHTFFIGAYNNLYEMRGPHLESAGTEGCYFFRDFASIDDHRVLMAAHHFESGVCQTAKAGNTTLFPVLAYAVASAGAGKLFSSYYANMLVLHRLREKQALVAAMLTVGEDVEGQSNRTTRLVIQGERLWQATTNGLRLLDTCGAVKRSWVKTDADHVRDPGEALLAQDIRDIHVVSDTEVWVMTDAQLLKVVITGDQFHVRPFCCAGLSGISSLAIDGEQRMWVGSSSGLYVFQNGERIFHFTQYNGLVSGQVTALAYDSHLQRMLVGMSEGLSVIDIKGWGQSRETAPRVHHLASESNAGLLVVNKDGFFSISEGDFFKTSVYATNLGEAGPLVFKYELDGAEVGFTSESSLVLSSLSHGRHELYISARTENSPWSEPVVIVFDVTRPWYRTGLFLSSLGSVMIITLFISILLWQRKRHEVRLREIFTRDEINRLKLQSLRSMMRPHFIANVISAVRHSLRNNDRLSVDMAMSRLSRLMRDNLQMVQAEKVLVKEEMEWLSAYIELERYMRNALWTFEINMPAEAGRINIPTMVVQPFVENAILYALPGKEGKLTIDILPGEQTCSIIITDNGPGFNAGEKQTGTRGHVSRGINIVLERLAILGRLTGKEHSCEIVNGRVSGKEFGIMVTLRLPRSTESDVKIPSQGRS